MALQINFPDNTDSICNSAYVIINLDLDNVSKTGKVSFPVWKAKEYRDSKKRKINNISLPIRAEEIWYIKEEVSEGQVDPWPNHNVGDEVYVMTLSWDDFAWKNGSEVYTKAKTLVIHDQESSTLIDLSIAIDI